jgi:hypothetical protein
VLCGVFNENCPDYLNHAERSEELALHRGLLIGYASLSPAERLADGLGQICLLI